MKWVASDNSELNAAIEKVWGRLRIAEDSDRKQVVERMKELLSSGKSGNPAAGQLHFKRICSSVIACTAKASSWDGYHRQWSWQL